MADNLPFFSIIIPSRNEEINLPQLLDSLVKQTDPDFEVIVVDSGSTDKTKDNCLIYQTKLPSFSFISHTCPFVSFARNYGSHFTKGQYLIFFDADVMVEENFMKEMKEKIITQKLDVTSVWNRPKENYLSGKLILFLLNINMSLFQKIKPAANGPCIIIRKTLFEEIKGFDETIKFGEDFDLVRRATKNNKRFAVFSKPLLFVSTRRFEQEGLFYSLYKSLKALFYQLFFGPIRKDLFEYKMGGEYYKKDKPSRLGNSDTGRKENLEG